MDLEDQIAGLTNPQEFTRVCNSVLTAIHGTDYQCVDGTRGDDGVDGYVRSEERVLAFYCPIKPERRTDADFEEKARSDLGKAFRLRDKGGLKVRRWTFVTPRKLPAGLLGKLATLADSAGIEFSHLDGTFLATEIARHPEVVKLFPFLHISTLEEKIDELLRIARSGRLHATPDGTRSPVTHSVSSEESESDDVRRVLALRIGPRVPETKIQLRGLLYMTTDDLAKLNAVFGLLDLREPLDPPQELVALCDQGIAICVRTNEKMAQAILQAHKGLYLMEELILIDIRVGYTIRASEIAGISLVSHEERQRHTSRIDLLNGFSRYAFGQALELAKETADAPTTATVMLFVGMAMGQRANVLQSFARSDVVQCVRSSCKFAFLAAKDISASVGNEIGVGYALSNLANFLRFWGEHREALLLAEEAARLSDKYKDENLARTTNELVRRLRNDDD